MPIGFRFVWLLWLAAAVGCGRSLPGDTEESDGGACSAADRAAGRRSAARAHVYAVDTKQQQQAWTAPVGGWLAVGEGKLLVARPDGVLSAFSLSQ